MKPAAQWFLILFIYFDSWLLLLPLMSTQTLAAAKAKGAGRQRPKMKTVLTQYRSVEININIQAKGLRVCSGISIRLWGLCV